jgi:hypothetical protein
MQISFDNERIKQSKCTKDRRYRAENKRIKNESLSRFGIWS